MDIQVTLGLNDTEYKSKLKAADAQAKSFAASSVNAFGAVQSSASRAGDAVAVLNNKFDGLAKALVGVGVVAFAQSLFTSADALDDMAKALDVNISRMAEMGIAASNSGSSLEGVNKILQKLEVGIGEAAEGSDKMRAAFEKVGESGQTLSSSSLDLTFLRIAKSLSEISDPAERAAKANELFGKSARGFDFGSYVTGIEAVYGTMDKYAESTKRAAEISDRVSAFITLLRAAFLDLLDPIIKLVQPTGDFAAQMKAAETAAKLLAIGLAAIAVGPIINGIKAVTGVFAALAGSMGVATLTTTQAAASATLYSRALSGFLTPALNRVASATANLAIQEARLAALLQTQIFTLAELAAAENAVAGASARLSTAQAGLAAVTATASTTIAGATAAATASVAPTIASGAAAATASTGWRAMAASMAVAIGPIYAAIAASAALYAVYQALLGADGITKGGGGANWISDLLSITDETKRVAEATKEVGTETGKNVKRAADQEAAAKKAAASAAWRTTTAVAGLYLEAQKIRDVTKANREAQDEAAARIRQQISLVQGGVDDRGVALALAGADAEYKKRQDILKIDQEIAAQRAKLGDPDLTTEQKSGIAEVIKAYEEQKKSLDGIVERTKELKDLDMERAGVLEMQSILLDAQTKAADKVFELQQELDQQTMSSSQRRLDDVNRGIAAEQRAAVKSFENAAKRKASEAEIAAINKKVAASYDGIYEKTKRVIDQSRQFSTGWKKAMNDYIEDATNGAKAAESLFKKAFQGMEDAIVKFAKTGKFEWKEFVASMLEELLRSQIKQLFANLMESMTGSLGGLASAFGTAGAAAPSSTGSTGGGLLDAIAGIFGTSATGSKGTPVYVTNMPGGAGGFSTPGAASSGSSVIDQIGSIFNLPTSYPSGNNPDEDSGGGFWSTVGNLAGSISSGIGDVVSSVGSAISDLFGGWFADGGQIPPGRFGIVGERGPEFVSGPATVTPMGAGGTTNVTYNINAVDALSFKQMIAADPTFIYAVTMQGQKGMRA